MTINGANGIRRANATATSAITMPMKPVTIAIGSTNSATAAFRINRRIMNGRKRIVKGRKRSPNRRPKNSRNGSVNRQNTAASIGRRRACQSSGSTRGGFEKFRSLQLIRRPTRRGRGQVGHRLVRNALVEALDHHGGPAGCLLRLREPDDNAEPDEQHQHEYGTSAEPLERANH